MLVADCVLGVRREYACARWPTRLGATEGEQHYARLDAKIRGAFRRSLSMKSTYIPRADYTSLAVRGHLTIRTRSQGGDTQTTYVLALHMNLLPEAMRAEGRRLVKKIEENHGLLGTGFVGTPYLLEELTKTGHTNLAYDLLLNTRMPSWGYQVEHGATTTWERWNGDRKMDDPQMNSLNHYAYGAVADWMYVCRGSRCFAAGCWVPHRCAAPGIRCAFVAAEVRIPIILRRY